MRVFWDVSRHLTKIRLSEVDRDAVADAIAVLGKLSLMGELALRPRARGE